MRLARLLRGLDVDRGREIHLAFLPELTVTSDPVIVARPDTPFCAPVTFVCVVVAERHLARLAS